MAVAQDMGITVGYLPGLSMRRIAYPTPGNAKTMPHALKAITNSDEDADALSMLTGFDPDLARQINQTEGRIRGQSFTQIHPALERVLGPWPGARRHHGGPSPPGPPQPT